MIKSLEGQRIGPYQISSLIGAGGMGEVYKARDTRLDRTVAIKVLPQQLAHNPQARDRFEGEARAVAALNHPHICTLYDISALACNRRETLAKSKISTPRDGVPRGSDAPRRVACRGRRSAGD